MPTPLVCQTLSGPGLTAVFLSEWDALDRCAQLRPCPRGLATTGGLAGELRVATARLGGRLVGVWPMVRLSDGLEAVLVRAGGRAQAHDGPTVHPSVEPGPVVAALWTTLESAWDVDAVHFERFLGEGPVTALSKAAQVSRGTDSSCEVWIDAVPAPPAADSGSTFLHLTHPDARWTALSRALGWSASPTPTSVDEQLLSLANHPDTVEVFALQVDGQAVAVQVGLREAGRYTVLHTRVDPALVDCGTEGLLLLEVAGWCAQQAVSVLDLAGPLPADVPWLGVIRWAPRFTATVRTRHSGTHPSRFDATSAAPLLAQLHARSRPASPRRNVRRVA